MRLTDLETLATRTELKQNPQAVIERATADIATAEAALAKAGQALQKAKEAREAGYQKLAALNREFALVSAARRNSKTLALEGDLPTMWSEVRKNRMRREALADLIAYQTLWIAPAVDVAIVENEIEVEECKASFLEAQCAVDRARMYSLAIAARGIDAGAEINLEGSASARVLKNVERARREIIPGLQTKLQEKRELMNRTRNEASTSIFG